MAIARNQGNHYRATHRPPSENVQHGYACFIRLVNIV
jgi:hypothetical protein